MVSRVAYLGNLQQSIQLEIREGVLHISLSGAAIDIQSLLHTREHITLLQIKKSVESLQLTPQEKLNEIKKYLLSVL